MVIAAQATMLMPIMATAYSPPSLPASQKATIHRPSNGSFLIVRFCLILGAVGKRLRRIRDGGSSSRSGKVLPLGPYVKLSPRSWTGTSRYWKTKHD